MSRLIGGTLAFLLVVTIALPAVLVRGCDFSPPTGPAMEVTGGLKIKVYIADEGRTDEMPLEEYVQGVVAAEMPARFQLEALKAQATAARTLALRRMKLFGGPGARGHPDADISTAPDEGQAWLSREALRKRWGLLGYYRYWPKIEQAVRETEGMIITYQGLPIDPVYHSTSAGPTENSEDVWQEAVPYLRSVPCEYDKHSPHYSEKISIPLAELAAKVGQDAAALSVLAGNGQDVIQVLSRSVGGRVKEARVGSMTMKGTELRSALGLPSTRFEVRKEGNAIVFETRGYGHGVGMCQYGADGLARLGKTYAEILKYYYTGVQIEPIFAE